MLRAAIPLPSFGYADASISMVHNPAVDSAIAEIRGSSAMEVRTLLIEPGSPWKNGYCESFKECKIPQFRHSSRSFPTAGSVRNTIHMLERKEQPQGDVKDIAIPQRALSTSPIQPRRCCGGCRRHCP